MSETRLAYQGKKDCQSVVCTSMFNEDRQVWECRGWHCGWCHKPSSYQGHVDCFPELAGEKARPE